MPHPLTFGPGNPTKGEPFELTWELFGELCRVLALRVARDYQPELVIGIAKAGVLPGAVVASILRADFHCMKISRREGDSVVRERPEVFSEAPRQARDRRVLIVDELSTSGETLRLALAAVRAQHPTEVRTAATFVRPQGYRPNYHALESDALIVFPWDKQVFEDGELVVHPTYR